MYIIKVWIKWLPKVFYLGSLLVESVITNQYKPLSTNLPSEDHIHYGENPHILDIVVHDI